MRISDWSSDVCSSDLSFMSFRRSLLPVLLLTLLAACAAQGQATDCADGAFPMARLELYFGPQRPGGAPVTEPEWAAFPDGEVASRLPDGLPVLEARKSVVEGKRVSVCVDLGGRRT